MVLKLLARLEGLCSSMGVYVGLLRSPSLAFALPRSAETAQFGRPESTLPEDEEDDFILLASPIRCPRESLRLNAVEAIARLRAFSNHRVLLPDLDQLAPAVAAAILLLGRKEAIPTGAPVSRPVKIALQEFATLGTGTSISRFRNRVDAFSENWKATFHLAAASRVPFVSITGMPWSARAVSATYLGSSPDPHGTTLDAAYRLERDGRIISLTEQPEHYLGCLACAAFQQSSFLDVLFETAFSHDLRLEAVGVVPCPSLLFEEWILPRLSALLVGASQRERFGALYDSLHIVLGVGEESSRGLCVGEVFLPRCAERLVDLARRQRATHRREGRTLYQLKFPAPSRLFSSDALIKLSDTTGWSFQYSQNSTVYSAGTGRADPDLTTLQSVLWLHAWSVMKAALIELFMRVFARGVLRGPELVFRPHIDQVVRPLTPSTQVPNDSSVSERSSIVDGAH
eukprot:Protomagalhaensia_wolfi_Nauph_80__6193@NODE_91_length_3802_cov_379_199309_g68_i0_p1_GENE_NODE_91_length_3802_cov_379_199309_g68_i0NODE_91_length_3802_cov_379_199309_g68_i0_p1_ORF_typecomplete_len457_score65_37_NODE_91_length_3802_cov_379_199309_g68_i015712941